jgi:hypothetical protein
LFGLQPHSFLLKNGFVPLGLRGFLSETVLDPVADGYEVAGDAGDLLAWFAIDKGADRIVV